MNWLKQQVKKIESLLEENSESSLTYGALECRLTIEMVCYERLRIAHDYISSDDIYKWQPANVVKTLIQDVDENITSTFTLSISTEPVLQDDVQLTKKDFAEFDYVEVGTQQGFKAKRLGELWYGVSKYLHVAVPKNSQDKVSNYGDSEKLRKKLVEVLNELKTLSEGTMTSSGFGEEVHFTCICGAENKRKKKLLKHSQAVNCIDAKCRERWAIVVDGDHIGFERKTIVVACHNCAADKVFAETVILSTERNQRVWFACMDCGEKNYLIWALRHEKPGN